MTTQKWDERRLYGRSQGKALRATQAARFDTLLPQIAVSADNAADTVARHTGPVWLEVGFGGGEHLAWQATRHPDTLMLGAEPFLNGVAKLLARIDEDGLSNIRVCHGDVRPLMTALPAQSVSRIFVLHPDPWPKSRHFKRRMISPEFLSEATRLLRPGGELRVSSDIADYVRWTLMQVQMHNRERTTLEWTATCRSDWHDRPDDWPQTRYELKARREGRIPAYLSFRRLPAV